MSEPAQFDTPKKSGETTTGDQLADVRVPGSVEVDHSDNTSSSTADVAKDEASGVANEVGQTGQHVASVAKDEVGSLASEAGQHAQNMLSEAKSSLTDQASSQQGALASFLRGVADDLHAMVEPSSEGTQTRSGGDGPAGQAVRQVSDRAATAASWLEDRKPADLLEDVTRFARRSPGTFLLIAGVAGVAAGRLTRGLKDDHEDTTSSTSVNTRRPSVNGSASTVEDQVPNATGVLDE